MLIEFYRVYIDPQAVINIGGLVNDKNNHYMPDIYFNVHFNGTMTKVTVPAVYYAEQEKQMTDVQATFKRGEEIRNELFRKVMRLGD